MVLTNTSKHLSRSSRLSARDMLFFKQAQTIEYAQCVAPLTCAWYHMNSAREYFTRVELKSSEFEGLSRVQGPVDFLLQRLFGDGAGQRDLALQANEGN